MKGIVSVYCEADCLWNSGGKCQKSGINIDSDKACEDFEELCEHPDSKNGVCLACGEET